MSDESIPGMDRAPNRRVALRRIFNHLAILFCLLSVWEFVTVTGIADELLFPRPTEIIASFAKIFIINAIVWEHLYVTMITVLAGFALGTVMGIGLAIFAGLSETIRRYLKPYIIILEATPRIAIGPLVLAWLGFGFGAKLAIVTLVCFFAPFVNTLTGILTTDEQKLELMRSLGATRRQILTKVMIPDAMPIIMAGIRLAMASALGGALVAEFISSNEGMGVLLDNLAAVLDMPAAFAALLTLTVVGFFIYRTMEIFEERVIFWQHDESMLRVARKRQNAWRVK